MLCTVVGVGSEVLAPSLVGVGGRANVVDEEVVGLETSEILE